MHLGPHSPHQHFPGVVTAGEVSLTHGMGAKRKRFPLGLFSPGNPICCRISELLQVCILSISSQHLNPAAKSPVIPPDFCHPLKIGVWKREQEQREGHTKALHVPDVDQCPAVVITTGFVPADSKPAKAGLFNTCF